MVVKISQVVNFCSRGSREKMWLWCRVDTVVVVGCCSENEEDGNGLLNGLN